jgi:flavin-dependent dehydrogenase
VHRRFGSADVYLVGDAAGQVKVTTVGGIVTGFRGARAVVEMVLTGSPGRELRDLRRELDLHLRIRRALHRFTIDDYRRLLDLLSPAVVGVLGSVSRDEALRVLCALCVKQPKLLLMGLRSVIRDCLPGHAAPPAPVWVEDQSVTGEL